MTVLDGYLPKVARFHLGVESHDGALTMIFL